jgi:hypothetical protein
MSDGLEGGETGYIILIALIANGAGESPRAPAIESWGKRCGRWIFPAAS